MPRFFLPYEETEPDENIPPGWNQPIPSNPDWPLVPGQTTPPLNRGPYQGPHPNQVPFQNRPWTAGPRPAAYGRRLPEQPRSFSPFPEDQELVKPIPSTPNRPDPTPWSTIPNFGGLPHRYMPWDPEGGEPERTPYKIEKISNISQMADPNGVFAGTPAQQGQARTQAMPLGPQPGQLHRLSQYDNLGRIRPFGPGEFLRNPDGSMSSEESLTVQMPNGQWAVVPGLWLIDGVPHKVNEDQAAEFAQRSGLVWPTFDSLNWAEQFANHRENIWERTPFGRTDAQPPLWSRQQLPFGQ